MMNLRQLTVAIVLAVAANLLIIYGVTQSSQLHQEHSINTQITDKITEISTQIYDVQTNISSIGAANVMFSDLIQSQITQLSDQLAEKHHAFQSAIWEDMRKFQSAILENESDFKIEAYALIDEILQKKEAEFESSIHIFLENKNKENRQFIKNELKYICPGVNATKPAPKPTSRSTVVSTASYGALLTTANYISLFAIIYQTVVYVSNFMC